MTCEYYTPSEPKNKTLVVLFQVTDFEPFIYTFVNFSSRAGKQMQSVILPYLIGGDRRNITRKKSGELSGRDFSKEG